ncbi:GAF domain-containing protein [Roseibium aggregatum]|uniref:GAF domain-containing protein n=1 Tax=Roseibium aggregatum TaxID=187304 RepID=UPI001E5D8764|nr:GAF domain-containing protein [Roseibium aggregatum]UES46520.1 GAF domain-containing protein [Roseibium aggregatum]
MGGRFKEEFARVASQQIEHKTASIALLNVVLPLLIAILGVSTPYLWNVDKLVPIGLWLSICVIYILSWWRTHPTYSDIHRLLLQKQNDDAKIDELNEEVAELKKIAIDLGYKNIASFIYRVMSLEYIQSIKKNGLDRAYFSEILDEILSLFYLQGDAVFGFAMSEKWSIGVYIFDKQNNVLKAVWRQKSNSHPSRGFGRDWIPGEGHVGKAFLDRRPILTGNANDDAVSQLCRSRGSKQLEYDNSTYVSFASVPIAVSQNDDDDPFGVLVVSSNLEDRLSEESITELLMHAAQTIAVILELSDADIGCLVNTNHDINKGIEGETNVGSGEKI